MKLRPYQVEALDFVRERPRSAWYAACGLGKTFVSLSLTRELIDEGTIKKGSCGGSSACSPASVAYGN